MTSRAELAERLLRLVDDGPEAFLVLDRTWQDVYANAAVTELRRQDAKAVQGESRLLHPDTSLPGLGVALARVMAGGPEERVEHYYPPLELYLRVRVMPLAGGPDGLDGVAVAVRDITEPHRHELRQRELYQQVLDQATSPVSLRDLSSRFLLVNEAGARLIGLPAHEIIGRTIHELFAPGPADAMRRVDLDVQRSQTAMANPAISARYPDRQLVSHVYPVYDADGQLFGTGTVITDVSELARAQAALVASQERHRSVFAGTSLGLLVVRTTDDRVVEANDAVCRLLGYSREELMAMSATDLVPGDADDLARRRAGLEGLGPDGAEVESVFVRSDEQHVTVLVTVNLFDEPGGEEPLLSMVLRDQTQVHELQARLVRGERLEAVGRLATGLAHDANNILAAVSGFAELLAADVGDLPVAQRNLTGLQRSIDRAGGLVRQLVAFTRGQQLTPTALDLGEVVSEMTDMLRRLLPPGVELVVETGPAPAYADLAQVQQVVLNLVVNAGEAVRGAGRVVVTTSVEDQPDGPDLPAGACAQLAVTDDGPGMEPEVARRCFEPFFTTRTTQGGTGLGLSTAHGIAQQSGGDLRVTTAPGRGARFLLLLPVRSGT